MPAKPSGQIKTSVIKKPQKNGDTYILERRTIYDPEKKYTKVLSTKLIAKIQKALKFQCLPGQNGAKTLFRIQKRKL